MIYSAGSEKLEKIRQVMVNKECEIWNVCQVSEQGSRIYFTLLLIKNHNKAKIFMEALEAGRKNGRFSPAQVCSAEDGFCVLYPWHEERLLEKFYKGGRYSAEDCRQICINLAAECLAVGEPWQILYLLLDQRQINLHNGGKISFGCQIDLSRLKSAVGEQDCAVKCAGIILWMMEQNRELERTMGVKLIQKKYQKEGYTGFTELLRDIQMDSGFWEKKKAAVRFKEFIQEKQETVLGVFEAISVLLGILALVMIFSQIIAGDIPLLRIFTSSFEKIGTESLMN